jgi:hypothetical protein
MKFGESRNSLERHATLKSILRKPARKPPC